MSALFTVLLPVHRSPELLPSAIESVLSQTAGALELFVICDGAPESTVACAQRYASTDPRVRVFSFSKGERFGEANRHVALKEASGRYVAHIADDDLWMPNHLEEMAELLQDADFGNTLHVSVLPNERLWLLPCDLSRPELRERMLREKFNRFGLSFGGYRLDAYRRLPVGWSPAPASLWTDLHMWRKFLRCDDLRFATRMTVTALCFLSSYRADLSLEERAAEHRDWFRRVQREPERRRIVEAAWRSLVSEQLSDVEQLRRSRSWRCTAPLRWISDRARNLSS
jgi:glycosyltransferase involved in cell wall biosynthesis